MNLRKFALGTVTAAAMASVPAVSSAAVIQLGFILDRSGSIGASGWSTIVNGLSSAVGTLIPVGGANTYEVSVVTFASTATVDVAHVLVTDATTRLNLANQIATLDDGTFLGGNTNYEAAFTAMTSALAASTAGSTTSYVNFATDGDPTTRTSASCSPGAGYVVASPNDANNWCGFNARQAMVAAGVDNISIEAIGAGIADQTNLLQNYCYPGPCDTTVPYNFPTQGFLIAVANADGYAAAIGNKIKIVTETPEPASLALVGLALAGMGAMRRRVAA